MGRFAQQNTKVKTTYIAREYITQEKIDLGLNETDIAFCPTDTYVLCRRNNTASQTKQSRKHLKKPKA